MTRETGNRREKRMDKLLRMNYKHTRFGGWGGRGFYKDTALEWNRSSSAFRKGTFQKPARKKNKIS